MSTKFRSKWTNEDKDSTEAIAQKRREKEQKKQAKAEKTRKAQAQPSTQSDSPGDQQPSQNVHVNGINEPSAKRRKTTDSPAEEHTPRLLEFPSISLSSCRDVDNFERLNDIDEGTYGWVARGKEKLTGEIVALKKLKMDTASAGGFPVTGLREIQTLKASNHSNIVKLREVVTGTKPGDIFLVMEFVEHDLKTLLEDMQEPFLQSEIKTIVQQIVSATHHLHSNWIIHRDLKTSNLLMNNRGEVKLADFGLARYTGDPPPEMTQRVVTLWYRSPELLLGADTYGTEIDIWSIGCIFAELLTKDPLFQGQNEVGQLSKIFALLGPPSRETWPGFQSLPNARAIRPLTAKQSIPSQSSLASKFPYITQAGLRLLNSMLNFNPDHRPSAAEILGSQYFREDPKPKAKAMFPTFPSKAGQEKRRRRATPQAPARGEAPKMAEDDLAGLFAGRAEEERGAGFTLRMG